ncbi:hypothetical protein EDB86DRAFT_2879445 [Lactarius hatsudake]|nr:hypothetical protein EDB86DRAFT_2879445 [Lactarius hatsudake]
MSSYLKDLVCSPRPYAPVVQLAVGDHHLEYGLRSTHSTNSASMALVLGAHVYDFHRLDSLLTTAFATWIILGIISWSLQHLVMPEVENWAQSGDWSAPLVVTVVCLILVNQHPSPDAIAFASVILGIIMSFWCSKGVPALNTDLFTSLVTGVLIIFSWRILAKPSVQTLLPPLFRWLAWASPVRLPHGQHCTPATEYVHGPPHTLQAVPSMIDLDLSVAEVVNNDAGVASGRRGRSLGAVKRRGSPSGSVQEKAGGSREDGKVKRCDADVLTKVVVYVGIGAIATVMVPALFEALEWGV